MRGDWIELRCDGKMHGQLNIESLTLVTARGDWVYVYDLVATARERRPIVTRLRAEEYPAAPDCGTPLGTGVIHRR